MTKFFVPYKQDIPVTVNIKGHRLLLLSEEVEEFTPASSAIPEELENAEFRAVEFQGGEMGFSDEDNFTLAELASEAKSGVVVTPAGVSMSTLLHELEKELPWVH